MRTIFKKLGALAIMTALVVSSGVFGIKAEAAERPSNVTLSIDVSSVAAGDTINITTSYDGDVATSIKFDFYSPYAAYDYNLNSYGYSVPSGYYGGIGSFSATAANLASGATNTVTIPSSVYGSYKVKATVTNATGSSTGTGSVFISNTSLDTAKPSVLSASVSVRNNGSKTYVELLVNATDDYARQGQKSSEVAGVQAAFENVDKPGTWTKTMSLVPVPNTTGVYIGTLDMSSIETPGTYVLNSMTIADTSGNVAKYKKSGNTLQSSSSDVRFFPDNLAKVTFKTGDVAAEEPTTTVKDSQTTEPTQVVAQGDASASGSITRSPKTTEGGTLIIAIMLLAASMCVSVAVLLCMSGKASKVKSER